MPTLIQVQIQKLLVEFSSVLSSSVPNWLPHRPIPANAASLISRSFGTTLAYDPPGPVGLALRKKWLSFHRTHHGDASPPSRLP